MNKNKQHKDIIKKQTNKQKTINNNSITINTQNKQEQNTKVK